MVASARAGAAPLWVPNEPSWPWTLISRSYGYCDAAYVIVGGAQDPRWGTLGS